MDIIVDVIIQIIRALLKEPDGKKPAAPKSGAPAAPSSPTTFSTQDPVYDDEGWRRLATVVGVVVLVILAASWIAYMQGWLPTG